MKKKSIALSSTIASWTLKLSLSFSIALSLVTVVEAKVKEIEIQKRKVEEDRVTLRVKVLKQEKQPVLNLSRDNFTVLVDGEELDSRIYWQNRNNIEPPEYEIIYDTPKPQRGKTYQVQVLVTEEGSTIESNFQHYRIIWKPFPLKTRLVIFICILLFLVVRGILSFWFWSQSFQE